MEITAAQEIFSTHFPKRQGFAYRWVASGRIPTSYITGRKTAAEMVLGRVPLLVVVNFWNPVTAIDRHYFSSCFQGEITNWQALGGADCPIEVLTYDQADLPPLPVLRPGRGSPGPDQEGMVAAVGATPGAIGGVTWPVVNPRVKVLTSMGLIRRGAWIAVELTTYPYLERIGA